MNDKEINLGNGIVDEFAFVSQASEDFSSKHFRKYMSVEVFHKMGRIYWDYVNQLGLLNHA